MRASGPGGQNVNKVSTAVALRFEAERSPQSRAGGQGAAEAARRLALDRRGRADRHRRAAPQPGAEPRRGAREAARADPRGAGAAEAAAADPPDRRVGAPAARRQGASRGAEGRAARGRRGGLTPALEATAAGVDVERVDRAGGADEQPVPLAAAERDIGDRLRQEDFADQGAVRRKAVHAVRGRGPEVAGIDPEAVEESASEMTKSLPGPTDVPFAATGWLAKRAPSASCHSSMVSES